MAIRGHGFIEPTCLPEGDAQMIVGFQKVRLELDRAAIRGHGFDELASVPERVAQMVVGLREIRFDLERGAARQHGFIEPAQRAAGFAEVGMSGGVVWAEPNGLPNPLHCEVMTSDLVSNDAEEVQRVGVVWVRCQDLPVERFRFGQLSRTMILNRDLKRLWDRHGGGRTENRKWKIAQDAESSHADDCPAHQVCHIER